ncbi:MAG: hypothetical protein IAE98_12800 [Candidatus Kapabacteria bacterium]|nr:hypothetical protein [Candidatus Kapabacteria bacterium]
MGAIIGGFVVLMIGGSQLRVMPVGVSYGDLAAIALTAVTVLLAVFALACAAAALYGYRAFMNRSASVAARVAEEKTESVATKAMEKFLEERLTLDITRIAQTVATRVISPEYVRNLVIEQIGEVTSGNDRDDRLDREADLVQPEEIDPLDDLDAAAEEDSQAGEEVDPQ